MGFKKGKPDFTWFMRQCPNLLRRLIRKSLPKELGRRYLTRHEDESMRLWAELCVRVPAGTSILDIGAYHGDYAVLARSKNPRASVAAFEPSPASFKVLETRCKDLEIEVCHSALSDTEGTAQFGECDNGPVSKIIDSGSMGASPNVKVFQVPQTTVDAWCCSRATTPSLMKIDVEGAETLVLKGAADSLQRHRPWIICEVLDDSAGTAVMAVLPIFYEYYYIDELGAFTKSAVITRRTFRNRNWLLLPREAEAMAAALV